MKSKLKLFLLFEYLIFIGVAIFLYRFSYTPLAYREIIYFILVLLLTNNFCMFFNTEGEIITTIILPVLFPVIVLYGPFWTAVIAAAGSIELKYRKQFVWYKFIFNRSMMFLAGAGAALAYRAGQYLFNTTSIVPLFLFSALIYFIINNGLIYLVIKITSENSSPSLSYFLELPKNLISSYFLGLFLYLSYNEMGKIFFVLIIILIYIFKDFLYSRLQQLNAYTQIIESFLKVIDSKDHYTEGHCERVAGYTSILCREMGLRKSLTNRIVNIAKIHDIGKIYVDDKILKSSERLTSEQYEEMKNHSYYGYEVLKDIDLLGTDIDIILYHHEWYNGRGYPEGMAGKDIPLGARILAVCDAFDVMTTGRSYKPALNKQEVIVEFRRCSGGQFDPEIAYAMIDLIKRDKFDDSFGEELENGEGKAGLQLSFNYR